MRTKANSLCLLLFFSPIVFAQANSSSSLSPMNSLAQVGVGLLLTLCAIGGLAWLVKRMGLNRIGNSTVFSILGQLPLGQREKLILVDVKGKQFLLSVCPGSINHLHLFSENDTEQQTENSHSNGKSIEELGSNSAMTAPPKSLQNSFADQLKVMMASGKIR